MEKVEVKKSKINGKGVFALRNFKKGEIIINWKTCSDKLSKEKFEALSGSEKKYVSFVDGEYILFYPPARYVNHSCDPNTKVVNYSDVAMKDIKKDEEITVDYVLENVPKLDFTCHCKSSKCKKNLTKL